MPPSTHIPATGRSKSRRILSDRRKAGSSKGGSSNSGVPAGNPAQLTVDFTGPILQMEFTLGKQPVFSGNWAIGIAFDGTPTVAVSAYEELCWVSDADVDYLELGIALSHGLRLERHIVLARQDRLLFLADVVLGSRPGSLEYSGRLPLADGNGFQVAGENREGLLTHGRNRLAKVLPLALPEWRNDRGVGNLRQSGAELELQMHGPSCRLFAPLFFDLERRRFSRPCTWRQLTVAESSIVQPPESAVGYRAAVGKQQWLIYRSLTEKANRSVLGHNLSTEFLFARFRRDGEVEGLIEVE
jgi:hypothetical protein